MSHDRCTFTFKKFRTRGRKRFAVYRCRCGESYETEVHDLFGQP